MAHWGMPAVQTRVSGRSVPAATSWASWSGEKGPVAWPFCATCQTGGKLLADRALSRLLKGDWPKTIDELEKLRPRKPDGRAQDRRREPQK